MNNRRLQRMGINFGSKIPHAPTCPTFVGGLSPELVEQLRANSQQRKLVKNGALYSQGSSPDSIFCVTQGAIKLSVTAANGREAVISVIKEGNWFGELSLFINEPRMHDARAVTDTELLVLSSAAVHQIVDRQPNFLLEFMQLICRKYKISLHRIDATILMPIEVRLARLLLAVEEAQDEVAKSAPPVHKVSQEELGHMLGVSRQSVNRQLKDWETLGILDIEYGRLHLKNISALQEISQ